MITKNVTVEYGGTVEATDTTDSNFISFDWELSNDVRTGNVVARAAFKVGNGVEIVSRTVPAAQLAGVKVLDVFNALRADLAAQLGL